MTAAPLHATLQGLFSDVPLIGVLALIHDLQHSGKLEVEADIPFWLNFVHGEVTAGGILDWQGLDAIQSSPLIPSSGSFIFQRQDAPQPSPTPLMPYDPFSTEWARVSDEVQRTIAVIGSPSAIFKGNMLPIFNQPLGCSVRAAAAFAGISLADMSAKVAAGVRQGKLKHTGAYAWFDLVLPPMPQAFSALARRFNGQKTLGQLITSGMDIAEVRADLIYEIRLGLRFEGCGWALRDLVWESQMELMNKV